jgi:hypothetical protein
MIVGLIGGVSRPTEFCRTFFVRRGEGTPPYGTTPYPCLSLWERWPSAARTERVDTKNMPVSTLKICQWHIFSVDLSGYILLRCPKFRSGI